MATKTDRSTATAPTHLICWLTLRCRRNKPLESATPLFPKTSMCHDNRNLHTQPGNHQTSTATKLTINNKKHIQHCPPSLTKKYIDQLHQSSLALPSLVNHQQHCLRWSKIGNKDPTCSPCYQQPRQCNAQSSKIRPHGTLRASQNKKSWTR